MHLSLHQPTADKELNEVKEESEFDESDVKRSKTSFIAKDNNGFVVYEDKSAVFQADLLESHISRKFTLMAPPDRKMTSSVAVSNFNSLQRNSSDNKSNKDKDNRLLLDRHSQDNYWKDRVDLLLYEKKNWMKEKKANRSKITELTVKLDAMELRTKHLQNVINRFGQYDKQEFEFNTPASASKEEDKQEIDPKSEIE